MTAQPGLAQDALQLYPYGNSGHQRVKQLSLGQCQCRESTVELTPCLRVVAGRVVVEGRCLTAALTLIVHTR